MTLGGQEIFFLFLLYPSNFVWSFQFPFHPWSSPYWKTFWNNSQTQSKIKQKLAYPNSTRLFLAQKKQNQRASTFSIPPTRILLPLFLFAHWSWLSPIASPAQSRLFPPFLFLPLTPLSLACISPSSCAAFLSRVLWLYLTETLSPQNPCHLLRPGFPFFSKVSHCPMLYLFIPC
jgi:hypothetical protein